MPPHARPSTLRSGHAARHRRTVAEEAAALVDDH